MRAFKILFGVISIVLVFFSSCSTKSVPEVNVNPKFIRIDSVVFSHDSSNIQQWLPELVSKYPDFMEDYFRGVLKVGPTNDIRSFIKFKYFIADMKNFGLDTAIENKFKNLKDIKQKTTDALKFYKYYFPEDTIPDIYFFNSGFNQSVITGKNYVGIALDKYLGYKNPYYMDMYMNMPLYVQYYAQKRFIPYDIIDGIFTGKYAFPEKADYNLLSNMIFEGKKIYFINKMFPEAEDSTLMKYTTKQIEWVEQNEKNIWTWLVEQKKLFTTDYKEIRSFVSYAPFTNQFSQESPGRVGVWVGWQIVKSYAENNNVLLPELMKENDFDKIMNKSKYKP